MRRNPTRLMALLTSIAANCYLVAPLPAHAQAPTVAATTPAANAHAAARANSAVAVTFSAPVTAASANNLAVFSSQVGGRKAGTVAGRGSVAVPLARGASTEAGWALVGNPFAAPFDPSSLSNTAGIDNAKYVFESTGAYVGTYRTYRTYLPGSPAPGNPSWPWDKVFSCAAPVGRPRP